MLRRDAYQIRTHFTGRVELRNRIEGTLGAHYLPKEEILAWHTYRVEADGAGDGDGSLGGTWADAETAVFAYDVSGRMTRARAPYSIASIAYDERGLPEQMSLGAGGNMTGSASYRYSAAGQRYQATVSMGSGSPGSARYYLADHLGSVRAELTATGQVTGQKDDYPFGLRMPGRSYLAGSGAAEDFTGHELDDETGLHYMGARYYMAALGRFTVESVTLCNWQSGLTRSECSRADAPNREGHRVRLGWQ